MSETRTLQLAIGLPIAVALCGAIWILVVTEHYESVTGRPLYMLAGYSYTVPKDGFVYQPGGQAIERWALDVPGITTLIALTLSLITSLVMARRAGFAAIVVTIVIHLLATAAFLTLVACYAFSIMGVFI